MVAPLSSFWTRKGCSSDVGVCQSPGQFAIGCRAAFLCFLIQQVWGWAWEWALHTRAQAVLPLPGHLPNLWAEKKPLDLCWCGTSINVEDRWEVQQLGREPKPPRWEGPWGHSSERSLP